MITPPFGVLLGTLGRNPEDPIAILSKNDDSISLNVNWTMAAKADEHLAMLQASYPAPGAHFWFGVQPMGCPPSYGRGKSTDVTALTTLYCDLDFVHEHKPGGVTEAQAIAIIRDLGDLLGTPPAAIVRSGYGMQPYWPVTSMDTVSGAMTLLRWRSLVVLVAKTHGAKVDTGVYDLPRILRIPGPPNVKYGQHAATSLIIPPSYQGHRPTADQLNVVFDSYLPAAVFPQFAGLHAGGSARRADRDWINQESRVFTEAEAISFIEDQALAPARNTPWGAGNDYWKILWQCALVCAAFTDILEEEELKQRLRDAIFEGHGERANAADEYQIALGFIKGGTNDPNGWLARLPNDQELSDPFSRYYAGPTRLQEIREQYAMKPDAPLVTEYAIVDSRGAVVSSSDDKVAPGSTPTGSGLVVAWAGDMLEEGTEWLWEYGDEFWLPLGELVLLGGREGVGKSTWTARLIAQVTLGTMHGKHLGTPKSVIVCASEDSWSKTLLPRFNAAGADLKRIARVDVRQDDKMRGLRLPTDIPAVEKFVVDHDVALIVLDPLLGTVEGKLDTHKDSDVRQALDPLTRLAHECEITIIGLIHQNKNQSGDLMTRLMGSRAFGAVARTVLVCAETDESAADADALLDPEVVEKTESERQFLFGQIKNNLGRKVRTSIKYEIQGVDRGIDAKGSRIRTSKIRVVDYRHQEGVEENVLAKEKAATRKDAGQKPEGTARSRATAWLTEYLTIHPGVLGSTVKGAGAVQGHSESTLKKVCLDLGVVCAGDVRRPTWTLPADVPVASA